ncbi:uncharacterized protein LOC122019791 isoform X1 [Zingiber officinale]|uniref:uncharacterized protein LOC122019791 isoform X1 n=1 Tax=Zingiber officinale TaxID=94328 RepID=UPI001C4CF6CB|nr:uncharacterized protein LOC122019791 isoform X1 [Zingiber officinale]XP_042433247.1 uncharacterized protein LOC122019791 isoform X1 [Zingiber officinale]
MRDMKHVEFVEPYSDSGLDKETGAGANAASGVEMTLIASTPLSELIWTPEEGLSLKYTDYSKAENKVPFLWKEEPFNTIISTSYCNNGGEFSTSEDSTKHSTHDSPKNADAVTIVDSHTRPSHLPLPSSRRMPQQNSRSFGDLKLVKEINEAHFDLNQTVRNDVGTTSAKDAINNIVDKITYPAVMESDFATTAGILNEPEAGIDVSRKNAKCSFVGVSGSHHLVSAKNGKSISNVRSTDQKYTDSAIGDHKYDNFNKLDNLSCLLVHGGQNLCGSKSKVSCQNNVASVAHHCCKCKTLHANTEYETAEFIHRKLEKGKEKVLHDEDYDSHSKEKESDTESAESCNSKRMTSKRNHSYTFDMKISEGFKRMKRDNNEGFKRMNRENNEDPCSGSLIKKPSSFINWMSTIASNFSRKTSLSLLPQCYNSMNENFGALRVLHEKSDQEVLSRTVGFNSFFQALYSPNFMLTNTIADGDYQRKVSMSGARKVMRDQNKESRNGAMGNFSQFKVNKPTLQRNISRTFHAGADQQYRLKDLNASVNIVCGGNASKSHNQDSSAEKNSYPVEDFPAIMINLSASSTKMCEQLKQSTENGFHLKERNNLISSDKRVCIGAKENENVGPSSDRRFPMNLIYNDKNSFSDNLWITHFLQKASSPALNSVTCNLSLNDNVNTSRKSFNDVGKNYMQSLGTHEQHLNSCKSAVEGFRMDNKSLISKSHFPERIVPPTVEVYEDRLAESLMKIKQKTSRHLDNEEKGSQIIPLCNSIVPLPDVTKEQLGIFKAIRGLHLSRTILIRWMKSRKLSNSLEGFFLRLRLGKWEKGPGGTGYKVARIISAKHENCLSVRIGNLKCSLECCFVSNHDFLEEELKTWWLSSTLEADIELPCMEELSRKLKEREELGL